MDWIEVVCLRLEFKLVRLTNRVIRTNERLLTYRHNALWGVS